MAEEDLLDEGEEVEDEEMLDEAQIERASDDEEDEEYIGEVAGIPRDLGKRTKRRTLIADDNDELNEGEFEVEEDELEDEVAIEEEEEQSLALEQTKRKKRIIKIQDKESTKKIKKRKVQNSQNNE